MKTVKYVVIRHGSNAFNQPMSSRSVLGVVEAKNKKEARETAEKSLHSTSTNDVKLFVKAKRR